jgi:SAM-dependent methyltransferase
MHLDVRELSAFYEAPTGQIARRHMMRRLRLLWPDVEGQRVLGYGFAVPYLKSYLGEAERAVALMPAQQGVVAWPPGRSLCALGEEDALPFPDALFDRILLVHAIEAADGLRTLMRQIWRVLAPAGRIVVVAPNRNSLWAQVESSPFAQGSPFTRGQLARLLDESMFVPERWDSALLFPPLHGRRLLRSGTAWESLGRRIWPQLAGVHLVEATKTLYGAPNAVGATRRKPVLAHAAR